MNIKYQIVEASKEDHSIVVRFYTDTISEESLAVVDPSTGEILRNDDGSIKRCRTDYNITLFDAPTLTGDALVAEIQRHAPKLWFEMLEKVADPGIDTSMTEIISSLGQEGDLPESVSE